MALRPSAPPLRHLLVALPRDAGEAAATLRWAGAHVARPGDALTLLHVRPADLTAAAPTPFAPPVELPLGALADELQPGGEAGAAAAEAAKALEQSKGVACVRFLKLRSPLRAADALLAYIAALPADEAPAALLLGSHETAANAERRVRASHASADVAAECPAPLFIVRQPAALPQRPRRLVALAVDGRAPGSALLARWACAHALRPSDNVLVCHVSTGHADTGDAAAAAREAAVADAVRLVGDFTARGGGSAARAELASAFDARDALVDYAETGVAGGPPGPPDLLLLASRGPAALRRAALGSVSAYVVAHAPCALCLVPPAALAEQPAAA